MNAVIKLAEILSEQIENEEWSDLRESLYENISFNNLINEVYKIQDSILIPVSQL